MFLLIPRHSLPLGVLVFQCVNLVLRLWAILQIRDGVNPARVKRSHRTTLPMRLEITLNICLLQYRQKKKMENTLQQLHPQLLLIAVRNISFIFTLGAAHRSIKDCSSKLWHSRLWCRLTPSWYCFRPTVKNCCLLFLLHFVSGKYWIVPFFKDPPPLQNSIYFSQDAEMSPILKTNVPYCAVFSSLITEYLEIPRIFQFMLVEMLLFWRKVILYN